MAATNNLREWYMEKYPTDDIGEFISESATLSGLYAALVLGEEVYDYIGGYADSIVRERCFQELSERLGCDYYEIYDLWLHGVENRKTA